MKTKYVVGFMFDSSFENVALIRKTKPEWQAGKLNGIGGKVELFDETNWHAMMREFGEETGVKNLTGWNPFCTMSGLNNDGSEFEVDCFYNHGWPLEELKSPEEEKIEIHEVKNILCGTQNTIGNLPWLITMAIDFANGIHPPSKVTAIYNPKQ